MNPTSSKLIITVLFFIFIFISGYRLSRKGKPYSALIITIHKLTSLAAGTYMAIMTVRFLQAEQLSYTGIFSVVITHLLFLGFVVSGGFMSAEKQLPHFLSPRYKVFPYLAFISSTLSVIFFYTWR